MRPVYLFWNIYDTTAASIGLYKSLVWKLVWWQELETKVIRRYMMILQSQREPLFPNFMSTYRGVNVFLV